MSAIPIGKPHIHARPRKSLAPTAGKVVWTDFMVVAAAFSLIVLLVFGASNLAGNVMVERARRDGISANQRLRAARAAQATLAREIEALSNEEDLLAWGKRNGFAAPQVPAHTSGNNRVIVARR